MSNKVFDKQYAEEYDLLYGDKDYEAECDFIEKIFLKYSKNKIQTILDLGCGTGNHSIPLALRGYDLTGVDSSGEMLTHAREKVKESFNETLPKIKTPIFLENNLLKLSIEKKFDAVLMMFAVLGYQLDNKQIAEALQTVRKHLKPGGIFIFDVWYGPAVLKIRPSDRVKIIPQNNGCLIRTASGALDVFHQQAEVNYHIWQICNNQVINETEETHKMRYFFPQELGYFITQAGMTLENLVAFPSLEQMASEDSWNALGICKNGNE